MENMNLFVREVNYIHLNVMIKKQITRKKNIKIARKKIWFMSIINAHLEENIEKCDKKVICSINHRMYPHKVTKSSLSPFDEN